MMPQYPRLRPDRDRLNDWYLDETVHIVLINGHVLILEKGFKFDSHSVPWWAQLVFPRYHGRDIYAAMVHDALVAGEHWLPYSRRFVDQQYAHFMREYQVTRARTYWMPKAVYAWNGLKYYWRDYRGEVPKMMQVTLGVDIDVV